MVLNKEYIVDIIGDVYSIKSVSTNNIIINTSSKFYADYLCMLLNDGKQTVEEIINRKSPDVEYLEYVREKSDSSLESCIIEKSDNIRFITISSTTDEFIYDIVKDIHEEAIRRNELCKKYSSNFIMLQTLYYQNLDDIIITINDLAYLLQGLDDNYRKLTINYLNGIYKIRMRVGIRMVVNW